MHRLAERILRGSGRVRPPTRSSEQNADDARGKTPDEAAQQSQRDALFHELYHITFLLRQKLDHDSARLVLISTDFYETYNERRRSPRPLQIVDSNSPQACFVGQPLRARARIQHPVRRVEFHINSRDQGWVNDRNAGSWSWFTAGIVRGSDVNEEWAFDRSTEPDRKIYPPWFTTPSGLSSDRRVDIEYRDDHEIYKVLVRDRFLCRNVMASNDFVTNTVVWSSEAEDAEEADWVRSLARGDRIVVRAWAQFPGWQNIVRGVKVTILNAPFA